MSTVRPKGVMLPNHSRQRGTPFSPFDEVRPRLEVIAPSPDKPSQFNVPTMMSVGLKVFYRRINAGAPPNRNVAEKFSDSKGNLIVDDKLPLLGRRYKPIGLIGKGTFSQLIEAEDTFHPSRRRVAVKVMKIGLTRIGIQESRCISFLNSTDTLDSTHIVRMFNTFFFGDHFCLVLELLHSNLIEHIIDLQKQLKPLILPPQSPPLDPPTPVLSPEPITPSKEEVEPPRSKRKSRALSQNKEPIPLAKKEKEKVSQQHQKSIKASPHKERSTAKRKRGEQAEEEEMPHPPADPQHTIQQRQQQQQKLNITLQQIEHQVQQDITAPTEQPLLPMWFIRSVAAQLIAAVGYLYQKGMLHADLKPENIMFRDNPYVDGKFHEPYLKITDFGNAIPLGNIALYHHDFEVQSLSYRAPEVICGVPFGLEIDMWSIGCILAEMCNGRLLFPYQDKRQLLHKMTSMFGALPERVYSQGKFYNKLFLSDCNMCRNSTFSQEQRFPDPFLEMKNFMRTSDFIFVDLNYDPKKRPTPQQALQHPFFAQFFTFSIFGDARMGTEIRRIHHTVNFIAMKIHESKNSEKAKIEPKQGCMLFDEDPHLPEEETPAPPPTRAHLQRSLELANSDLARTQSELAELTRSLNGKVFDFAKKSGNLEKEAEVLRAEIAELSKPDSKKRTAQLEKEIKQLRAELEKRDTERISEGDPNLEAQVSKEVAELRSELANRSSECRALAAKLLDNDLKFADKTRELQKDTEKLRVAMTNQADEHRQTTSDLGREAARMRGDIADLEKANADFAAKAYAREDEAARRILALDAETLALRARVGDWNEEKIKLVMRETTSLKKVTELEKEMERLRAVCNAVNEENTKLVTRENAAQRQISGLEEECAQLRSTAKDRNEMNRALTAKRAAQDADADRTARALETQITELRKGMLSAQDSMEKAQMGLRDMRTQTNALRVRSEQAEADSQTAHAALLRLGEENAALRVRSNELAGLKQEVEKREKEEKSSKSQLAEAQRIAEKALLEKEITVGKLQVMTKADETMKARLAEMEKEVERHKDEKEQESKTIVRLQEEVREKKQEVKGLKEERDEANKNCTEMKNMEERLQQRIVEEEEHKRRLDAQLMDEQQEGKRVQKEQKRAKKEVTRLTKLAEHNEAELAVKEEQNKALQEENERLQQQIIEKDEEVARLVKNSEEDKKQLQEVVAEGERKDEERKQRSMEEEQHRRKEERKRRDEEEKERNRKEEERVKEGLRKHVEKLQRELNTPTPLSLSSPSLPLSSPSTLISPTPPHRPTPSRPIPPYNYKANRNPSPPPPPSSSSLSSSLDTNIFFATPVPPPAKQSLPRLVPVDNKSKKETHLDTKKKPGKKVEEEEEEDNDDVLLL